MKTSKKDFLYFQCRVKLWQEILNLGSWRIFFIHEAFKEDENILADCGTDYCGRAATIRLNTTWKRTPITKDSLDESALHECLEMLLSPLWGQAKARTYDGVEYEQEHHIVIRTLDKVIRQKKLNGKDS